MFYIIGPLLSYGNNPRYIKFSEKYKTEYFTEYSISKYFKFETYTFLSVLADKLLISQIKSEHNEYV